MTSMFPKTILSFPCRRGSGIVSSHSGSRICAMYPSTTSAKSRTYASSVSISSRITNSRLRRALSVLVIPSSTLSLSSPLRAAPAPALLRLVKSLDSPQSLSGDLVSRSKLLRSWFSVCCSYNKMLIPITYYYRILYPHLFQLYFRKGQKIVIKNVEVAIKKNIEAFK